MAAIQETKLNKKKGFSIPNYSAYRHDRESDSGGGLVMLVRNDISYNPLGTSPPQDPMESQTVEIPFNNTHLRITNVYIPPESSSPGYLASIKPLFTDCDALILGDFNAHDQLWHSHITNRRGTTLAAEINDMDYTVLNDNCPTRLPPDGSCSSPDLSISSASLGTSTSWQTHTTLSSDHLPIVISLDTHRDSTDPSNRRCYVNLRKANWEKYTEDTDIITSSTLPHLSPDPQQAEKQLREAILTSARRNIPAGRRRNFIRGLPPTAIPLIKERDHIRCQNPRDIRLGELNDQIYSLISTHNRDRWREYVEGLSHKSANNSI